MRTLSIREMHRALGRIDELLDTEGEIVITRRGKAIARLLPARPKRKLPSNAKLRNQGQRLAVGSEVLIRRERDER